MVLIKCEKCGVESSDMYENCQNCGKKLEKGSVEADSPKQSKANFKWTIIISIICVVTALCWLKNTPITDNQKTNKIWTTYFNEGYDAAVTKVYEYYGTSDKAISILMVMNNNTKGDKYDIIDKIDIEQDMVKDGNYYDYTVTFENNSDATISYIKYTVYLKDKDKKTIHSDWSNWSGTLEPDAKVQTDTMIDYISGVTNYSIKIDKITTK